MASTGRRSLNDVLSELEEFFGLRIELEGNVHLKPLFSPRWFERNLRNKVQELGDASMDGTLLGSLRNLKRLVKVHRDLMVKEFLDLNDQLTTVINEQKSYVDSHIESREVCQPHHSVSNVVANRNKKPIGVSGPVFVLAHHPSLMSGAQLPPNATERVFPIKAIGSANAKFAAATERLCLKWNDKNKALECFNGGTNLTRDAPDFRIVPSDVKMFECAAKTCKVLLTSSAGTQSDVRLFVRLVNEDELENFTEYLREVSKGRFDRDDMDR